MPSMDLGMSDRVTPIYNRVKDMVRNEIMPLDIEYEEEIARHPIAGSTPSAWTTSSKA